MPSFKIDWLMTAGLCVSLIGCMSAQPVPYAGLASSPLLVANEGGTSPHIPFAYATEVDWRRYSRMIIEPVVIYDGPDSQFGTLSADDKARLSRALQAEFTARLATRFEIVEKPAPGTLRLRLTLTGARTTTPVLGTLSRFDVAGGVYNGIQTVRGGEGALTGSVTYAVEIFDATNGRLLKAEVSKRYPSPFNIKASVGALKASEVGIVLGADALLAELR